MSRESAAPAGLSRRTALARTSCGDTCSTSALAVVAGPRRLERSSSWSRTRTRSPPTGRCSTAPSAAAAIAETLVASTPLILGGLAFAIAARAGMFNIGIEGQLVMGGLCRPG